QWPTMPPTARAVAAATCVLGTLVLTFIRPGGRGLEDWLFVALRYLATPRASVWRPPEPAAEAWRADPGRWEELAPRPGWVVERRRAAPDAGATRRQLTFRCDEVARQLGRCGLAARRLGSAELAQLFYACWCPELARVQRLRRDLAAYTALVVRARSTDDGRP